MRQVQRLKGGDTQGLHKGEVKEKLKTHMARLLEQTMPNRQLGWYFCAWTLVRADRVPQSEFAPHLKLRNAQGGVITVGSISRRARNWTVQIAGRAWPSFESVEAGALRGEALACVIPIPSPQRERCRSFVRWSCPV